MKYDNLVLATTLALQRYPEFQEISEVELKDYIEMAFYSLQVMCSRLFERDTYTETVKVQGSHIFLHAVPVEEIVSVLDEKGNIVDVLGLDKDLGVVEVYPSLDGKRLKVTYVGGFETLPQLVVMATVDLAALLYRDKGLLLNLPDIRVVTNELPQSVQLAIQVYKLSL